MAVIRMTSLRRKSNGDYFARKSIPEDVRAAYEAAHGKRQEERFVRPASLAPGIAAQDFRDWDAEIVSRIERLRAKARGEGEPILTPRQAHALAGEWYSWFAARFAEDPDTPEAWDLRADEFEEVSAKFEPRDEHDDTADERPHTAAARRAIHQLLVSRGDVDRFLHEKDRMLSSFAMGMLLDAVEGEYLAALSLLRRRAEGDWARDVRPERFPVVGAGLPLGGAGKPSGLTVWSAFELWVERNTPAASSINRWRPVFTALRDHFGERDIATITADEAQQWTDSLPNEERSPKTVQEVWLKAARSVFSWAKQSKRLVTNAFAEASIAVPKAPPRTRPKYFREEEWRVILGATLKPPPPRMAAHNAAAQRWVPWICAYTGSRAGEACQLRAEDVFQHPSSFWAMRITPEAGTVKDREYREVPLHPDLIRQGFVEFAKAKRKGPLFYDPEAQRKVDADPTNPKRPPYVKARQKLADWTGTLGLDLQGVSPTHAWRHTFVQRAARAGIDRSCRYAMCGHAEGDGGGTYEPKELEDLAEAMGKFPRYEL